MPPKPPLPRGWKRRVRSSILSNVILNLLDSTIDVLSFKRPKSVDGYTVMSLICSASSFSLRSTSSVVH